MNALRKQASENPQLDDDEPMEEKESEVTKELQLIKETRSLVNKFKELEVAHDQVGSDVHDGYGHEDVKSYNSGPTNSLLHVNDHVHTNSDMTLTNGLEEAGDGDTVIEKSETGKDNDEVEKVKEYAKGSKMAALAKFRSLEMSTPSPPVIAAYSRELFAYKNNFTNDFRENAEVRLVEEENQREERQLQDLSILRETRLQALEKFRHLESNQMYTVGIQPRARPLSPTLVNLNNSPVFAAEAVEQDEEIDQKTSSTEDSVDFASLREAKNSALAKFRSLEKNSGVRLSDDIRPPPVRTITPPLQPIELRYDYEEDTIKSAEKREDDTDLEVMRESRLSALAKFRSLESGSKGEQVVPKPEIRQESGRLNMTWEQLSREPVNEVDTEKNVKMETEDETTLLMAQTKSNSLAMFRKLESGKGMQRKREPPHRRTFTSPPENVSASENIPEANEQKHCEDYLNTSSDVLRFDAEYDSFRQCKNEALETFRSLEAREQKSLSYEEKEYHNDGMCTETQRGIAAGESDNEWQRHKPADHSYQSDINCDSHVEPNKGEDVGDECADLDVQMFDDGKTYDEIQSQYDVDSDVRDDTERCSRSDTYIGQQMTPDYGDLIQEPVYENSTFLSNADIRSRYSNDVNTSSSFDNAELTLTDPTDSFEVDRLDDGLYDTPDDIPLEDSLEALSEREKTQSGGSQDSLNKNTASGEKDREQTNARDDFGHGDKYAIDHVEDNMYETVDC